MKLIFLLLVFSTQTFGASTLFENHDTLQIVVKGPLKQIFADRDTESGRRLGKVSLSYSEKGGPVREVSDVQIQVRGDFRSVECEYPPLRFDFGKESRDPVFPRKDDLKFVTHCGKTPSEVGTSKELIKEYLNYRLFNLYSPLSFNVRLVQVSYVDDVAGPLTQDFGFFLEKSKTLASRNGLTYSDEAHEAMAQTLKGSVGRSPLLNYPVSAHYTLLEFLIANYDFMKFGNLKLLGSPSGEILGVPYDLDGSKAWGSPRDLYERAEQRGKVFPSCTWAFTEAELTSAQKDILSKESSALDLYGNFELLPLDYRQELKRTLALNFEKIRAIQKEKRFLAFPSGCMMVQ